MVYDAQILDISQHPAGIGLEAIGHVNKQMTEVLGAQGGLPAGLTCRLISFLISFMVHGERESRGASPVQLAWPGGGGVPGSSPAWSAGLRSASDISWQGLPGLSLSENWPDPKPFPTLRFLVLWPAGLMTLQLGA